MEKVKTAPLVLMTDFGMQDSYVGVMKGVIAGIAPDASVIDLTHAIRPQDVAHAAYTLGVSVSYFPAHTIFCCVVDPGVGGARRAVAVEAGEWTFVLPANGILTRVLDRWPARRAVALSNPRYQLPQPSSTFHGRDIFAPAAAHLARGVPLSELGESLSPGSLYRLDLPAMRREGEALVGSIMHVDRFGNLISTISRDQLEGQTGWRVQVHGTNIVIPHMSRTFADVAPGQPVAYVGSDGYLELAVRNGNAAEEWGVGLGAELIVNSPRNT
ncbi:MAG: SAM hydrolase/SAM-dependent halogenase family protein [Ardenticatenaceae bacterium]